jgi:hypothetical protein
MYPMISNLTYHTQKHKHIIYIYRFSMCDTFTFDELSHDMFTLLIDIVLFSKL